MMRFLEALKNKKASGAITLIPDIKCFSPKEGDLLRGRDPVEIAKNLVSAGACALSVVTEEKEFHGSLQMLRDICSSVSVPVLRKDFVECEQDLIDTKKAGADAVLLMYSTLGPERLAAFYRRSLELGLTPFVETHTKEELRAAKELNCPLVGINNRDILILEKDDGDVSRTVSLIDDAPDAFIVAESGMNTPSDVKRALASGAGAVLVGTAVMTAEDSAEAYRSLTAKTRLKICGIMNETDIETALNAGADTLGFVAEYPVDVPWNLSSKRAAELISFAKGRCSTCIVTGGSPEKVLALAKNAKPDIVQLHYEEPLRDTLAVTEALHGIGIRVIRSIPTDADMLLEMFGTSDLLEAVKILDQTPVDALLFDSRHAGNAALKGLSINGYAAEITGSVKGTSKPFIIGGGITPDSADEIIKTFGPDCIDILTGSEDSPGCKSYSKIKGAADTISRCF